MAVPKYNQMAHIAKHLEAFESNIELETKDPVTRGGFTQVPNFILKSNDISVGAKLTYAMFLSYAWNNDFCFPGQERLAKDMGMTRQSANTHIKELERKGFIKITRRGQGKSNLYKLLQRAKAKK